MSESVSTDPVAFTSRFNRILAVVIWALGLFVVVATTLSGWREGAQALAPACAIALIAWIGLWRPRVEVDDGGVTLVNVLRRVRVPWEALIHVDTRFALTLHTPGHRYSAWAAPAPGRTGASMARRRDRARDAAPRRLGPDGKVAPGDLITTDSGAAADLVHDRWETLRETGRLAIGQADTTPVGVTWLWAPATAAIVVLAVAVVVVELV